MISRRSLLRTLALSPLAAFLGVKQPAPQPGRFLIARKVGADLARQRETEIDAYTTAYMRLVEEMYRDEPFYNYTTAGTVVNFTRVYVREPS